MQTGKVETSRNSPSITDDDT